jgi:hypothetical protein
MKLHLITASVLLYALIAAAWIALSGAASELMLLP